MAWPGLVRPGLFWRGLFWRGVTWRGVVWLGSVRLGLVWFGSVRFGLAGLVVCGVLGVAGGWWRVVCGCWLVVLACGVWFWLWLGYLPGVNDHDKQQMAMVLGHTVKPRSKHISTVKPQKHGQTKKVKPEKIRSNQKTLLKPQKHGQTKKAVRNNSDL